MFFRKRVEMKLFDSTGINTNVKPIYFVVGGIKIGKVSFILLFIRVLFCSLA